MPSKTANPGREIVDKVYDVAIAGGGLAGLTLALQLIRQQPGLSIILFERSTFPVAEATAKVGESTVEIGAHYLENVLGLKDHLRSAQLPKFGLRLFFGTKTEFSDNDEIGPSEPLPVPTYQIDRGVLENYLFETVKGLGVDVRDGCSLKSVDLDSETSGIADEKLHELLCEQQRYLCRWFIDACGRRGVLKKKLGLGKPNAHHGAANWFRVDKTIRVDDWSSQANWQARCAEQRKEQRFLSTNHLMGPGYWVWIIPLQSGVTSFGIVFDPKLHSLGSLNTYARTLTWLKQQQPQCAQALEDAEALDFRYLADYSYDCSQVFSSDRWAITGEAGVFIDPLYSPGTDFIAISNGYICDLIKKDFAGEDIRLYARVYQKLYDSFYRSTLELFQGNYAGFGDYRLMVTKLAWDQAYYWGVLGWLYFTEHYLDIRFMQKASRILGEVRKTNEIMQARFRMRGEENRNLSSAGRYLDFYKVPNFFDLNNQLMRCKNNPTVLEQADLEKNIHLLNDFSETLLKLLDDESNTAFPQLQLDDTRFGMNRA